MDITHDVWLPAVAADKEDQELGDAWKKYSKWYDDSTRYLERRLVKVCPLRLLTSLQACQAVPSVCPHAAYVSSTVLYLNCPSATLSTTRHTEVLLPQGRPCLELCLHAAVLTMDYPVHILPMPTKMLKKKCILALMCRCTQPGMLQTFFEFTKPPFTRQKVARDLT